MNIVNNYKEVLRKYTVFTGRASRAEFWYFTLASILISIVLGMFGRLGNMLGFVYSIAVLLPTIGVGIRRLHDTNRSGWWFLLLLIPVIGWIVLIVFYAIEGDAGDNQYGPNPKGASMTPAPAAVSTSPSSTGAN